MFCKNHLRRKKNLKALFNCCMGRYDSALEMLEAMQPYYMIDRSDYYTLKLLAYVSSKCGKKMESSIYRNSYHFFSSNKKKKEKYRDVIERDSEHLYKQFMDSSEIQYQLLIEIIDENLSLLKTTEAAVYWCLLKKIGNDIEKDRLLLIQHKYNYLASFVEDLLNCEDIACIVVNDSHEYDEELRFASLCKALALLGFCVTAVFDGNAKISSIMNYSNLQQICFEESFEDQTVSFLFNVSKQSKVSYLFGDQSFLKRLNEYPNFYKVTQMFHRNPIDFPYPRMDCLLVGDYYTTKSVIYKQDVRELVYQKPSVDFSIVIPARNSGRYLKYAIQTCLEQDFSGAYEVLVSDNSDIGNEEVKELVQAMDNPKIRYIRTPFVLGLAQSFEFAYLNAKGERIISIGSDDGLINSTLSILDSVYRQTSQNNIIHFEGSFFQWPEGNNNNGYIIVNRDALRKKEITLMDCDLKLKSVLKNFVLFTEMPILYMHTCISRSQIEKIISLTGKFEYGDSQDVYTGLVNLIVEKQVTYISHPLLVGGNSGIGVGQGVRDRIARGEVRPKPVTDRYRDYYSNRFNIYNNMDIISDTEHFFIMCEYEKMKGMGLTDKELLADEDYLSVFENIYRIFPLDPVDINLLIKQMDQIAQNRGEEFYRKYKHEKPRWMNDRNLREHNEKYDKHILRIRKASQKYWITNRIYSCYRRLKKSHMKNVAIENNSMHKNDPLLVASDAEGKKIDTVYAASQYISKLFTEKTLNTIKKD